MEFTVYCCINVLQETVIYCNKASNRIVSNKGFSVFFWITLSHEVSRHFPTHTSTYANFENLLHICCTPTGEVTPSLVENPMSHGRRNKSWIVSSRLHTAISQNIREIRTAYHANQIQEGAPHASNPRSAFTAKEIDK